MQGEDPKAAVLDYYLTTEQIFQELTRQAKTNIPVLEAAKQVDFSVKEPLTDQKKEEDYMLNLYISTFVLEDTPVEPTGWVQITIKPPTRVDPQPTELQPKEQPSKEQQLTEPQPQQQANPPAPVTVAPT